MFISGDEKIPRWVTLLTFVYLFSFVKSEREDLQCPTMPDNVFHGIVVDCSRKELEPHDLPALRIPVKSTTTLLLDYNNLRDIRNGSFSRLHKLCRLHINYSGITSLEHDSFEGLADLRILSLYGNLLDISQNALKFGVFRHTPLLQELNIGNNSITKESGNYSHHIDIFDSLRNLRYLYITSFEELYIGNEFEKLRRLERLDVYGSSLMHISNKSLEGIQYSKVKHFKLSFAKPYGFETGVFKNLPDNIISLTLLEVSVGNINLLKAMEPLHGRTIPVLSFNTVGLSPKINPKMQIDDGIIDSKNIRFLSGICISNLTWKNSNIMTLNLGGFSFNSSLQSCIKSIDISGNRLQLFGLFFITIFGQLDALQEFRLSYDGLPKHMVKFWTDDGWNILKAMSQMEHQEIDSQTNSSSVSLTRESKRCSSPPVSSPSADHNGVHEDMAGEHLQHTTRLSEHKLEKLADLSLSESDPQYLTLSSKPKMLSNATNGKVGRSLCIYLPEDLRYVSFDTIRHFQFGEEYDYLIFSNPNRVTEIYCRHATMIGYVKCLLLGLNNVRLIDLTGTVIQGQIPLESFDFFPNLQVLVLSQTQENPDFLQIYGRRLIKNIANLVYLDLSNNGLNSLPHGMFQENRLLQYLCLAKNRFSTIPFQIRLVPSLEILDLRTNALSSLKTDEQGVIDEHITVNRWDNFTLLLENNNLQCICSDFRFTAWMKRTRALFDPNGDLTCVGEDGKIVQIESFLDIEKMWRKCHGQYFLLLSFLLLFAMIVLYLGVFLISMYRTFIIGKLKQIFVPEFQRQTRKDFTYDVFIGYAEKECVFVRFHLLRYLEGILNLKAFVHQRDLRQDLLEMGTALKDSWRILLVITEDFLAHEMSENIMKTATFFESPSKQDSIVVMVTQDLLYAIPDYVLRVVKDENIIVLPDLEVPFSYEVTETLRTRILY